LISASVEGFKGRWFEEFPVLIIQESIIDHRLSVIPNFKQAKTLLI
jgi:hypothetical protein